jgi:transcriptional regulator with XRE-family HTH domain
VKVTLRKQFGSTVRALRIKSCASQEEFADKCGFARSYMSRIERGRANPSLDAIQILAAALDVSAAKLFEVDSSQISTSENRPSKVYVPFANDGSYFNPMERRPRSQVFVVGEKSQPLKFKDFDQALDYLRKMEVAKWWRRNVSGNWGLVTAVRWGLLP